MATLAQPPEPLIIAGLKGVIDYYWWRGRVCARSWPRSPTLPRAPAVAAQLTAFNQLLRDLRLIDPTVRAACVAATSGTNWTWRDAYTCAQAGNTVPTD